MALTEYLMAFSSLGLYILYYSNICHIKLLSPLTPTVAIGVQL